MDITMKQETQAHRVKGRIGYAPLADQRGGVVIMLVLMILVIMTVIGIVSSDTIVTENSIIRNVGIHKQNTSLVDAALMVGLQRFMQLNQNDGTLFDWAQNNYINNINNDPPNVGDKEEFINTIWYETTFTQRCLNPGNSIDVAAIDPANVLPLISARSEDLNGTLRYAVVGWDPVPGMPLPPGDGITPTWKQGRIIAEYVSADAAGNGNGFGLIRQELGIKQQWIP